MGKEKPVIFYKGLKYILYGTADSADTAIDVKLAVEDNSGKALMFGPGDVVILEHVPVLEEKWTIWVYWKPSVWKRFKSIFKRQ